MLNNQDYISKENGKFKVHREINNEDINFGVYDSLDEAIKVRNSLDDDGWPVKVVEKSNLIDKYIEKKDDDTFYVFKNFKNTKKTFGPYDSLKKAKIAKYNLISNGWDSDSYRADSKYGRFIKKEGNRYIISRFINNENHIFGKFDTLDEAIEVRDELIIDNWGKFNLSSSNKYGRYISFNGNYYQIVKSVDGKQRCFGSYKNLEDAKKIRDQFIKEDWKYLPINSESNIVHTRLGFSIYKRLNGNLNYFGSYSTKEEAIKAKNELIKNDWVIKDNGDDNEVVEYEKNIEFDGEYYTIERFVYDKIRIYGIFKNFNQAKTNKDKLKKSNWHGEYVIKTRKWKYGENIVPFDYVFQIKKEINGKIKDFGTYNSFEETVKVRNKLCKNNWEDLDSKISFDDIKRVYDSVEFIEEPKVPFPQADNFFTLINICNELNKHCLSPDEIKEKFNLQPRHYSFYVSAGIYLDLIVKTYDNLCLSKKGKEIFSLSDKELNLNLVNCILEHKPFYNVFSKYLENMMLPSTFEIFDILKCMEIYNVNSDVTLKRRSLSVSSWIKWIVKLYK
ncbi:SPOR domain-containing protein [Methanobrevibacter sp. UBA417]|jgi:hypothetical protein|uniref:SPOR domain-containing protein n=1 Tax=Methanobrevibacter sp. UBA417 TaxID=1915487 RepID=UPI0039B97A47